MIELSDEHFENLVGEALESLPGDHVKRIQNIAIIVEHDPSSAQREQLKLRHDQTLYGLYEGVPLSMRQGTTPLLPDKITLFKNPLSYGANTLADVKEEIRHTLWHEIGHYYGLDHARIAELE